MMYKLLITHLLAVIVVICLTSCDNNSTQKTDQTVEKVDATIENLAKTPNILQPVAKNVDPTINAVHSSVHVPVKSENNSR